MNVAEFLSRQRVPFELLPHRTTHTAQRLAQALDVPGDNVAKSVVLKADGRFVLAVLQATHTVDLAMAGQALGAKTVTLAKEDDVIDLFGDCEPGAIPPFGSSYGLETIVDEALTHDEYIVFETNCHDEAVSMHYRDYERLEHPQVASFSHHV